MTSTLSLFPGIEERLDVSQERAKLLAAQRVLTEEKTAILRREYAPIGALERVLGAAVQAVCDRLDQLPGQLRAEVPDLPQPAIDRLMTTIAAARADWAQTVLTIDEDRTDVAD
jgi:phage terminase Nu1 subunit (DNA packaging protein)